MKKSMAIFNVLILIMAVADGPVSLAADSERFTCKSDGDRAEINISSTSINVEMNETSCDLDSGHNSFQGPDGITYRMFSARQKACEWGDRFDVTTLANISVRFSNNAADLDWPLIFNFVLSSDTGGHLTFSREFLCKQEEL